MMLEPPGLWHLVRDAMSFRAPTWTLPAAHTQKEWMHFVVLHDEIDILLNFNVTADAEAASERVGRAVVLWRKNDLWDGVVDEVAPAALDVEGGRADAAFGGSRLRLDGDRYRISAAPRGSTAAFDLELAPLAVPCTLLDGTIGDTTWNWTAVPRWRASGWASVDGRIVSVEGASVYHDHNWGRWQWGANFGWSWGSCLPRGERDHDTVVFFQITDRARLDERNHGLLFWSGTELVRAFGDGEVMFFPEGEFLPKRLRRFPGAMSLLVPAQTTEVPRSLVVRAATRSDVLELELLVDSVCQIVVPNERDLGQTIINEAVTRVRIDGVISGRRVHQEARGVFELVTAA